MVGVENVDHLLIPVTDLPRADSFYMDCLGLKFKTLRKNMDGSPRQTYLCAGDNIIGLALPGVQVGASESRAPRLAVAVSDERFDSILKRLEAKHHVFGLAVNEGLPKPILRSAAFLDPDGNWVEVCVWHEPLGAEYLSHVVVETADLEKSLKFYSDALGMENLGQCGAEHYFRVRTGQLYGLRLVSQLSERSRHHGRGCHIAFCVAHDAYDGIAARIPQFGGKDQGDRRARDGLRPEGEKSTYFFDPDKNRLQITAAGPQSEEMLSDEEKWRRINENRAQQGRALSRWDRGAGANLKK
jgi:catechol 2,3-dioxygenase-like lactoylglutathione lyase family enzyme